MELLRSKGVATNIPFMFPAASGSPEVTFPTFSSIAHTGVRSIGTTYVCSGAATSHNVAFPATIVAKDLLILLYVSHATAGASATDFTAIANEQADSTTCYVRAFYKVAVGNETGNLAVATGNTYLNGAVIICFKGPFEDSPLDAQATNATSTMTDITAVRQTLELCMVGGYNTSTSSNPTWANAAGYVEDADLPIDSQSHGFGLGIQSKWVTEAGACGATALTPTNCTQDCSIHATFKFNSDACTAYFPDDGDFKIAKWDEGETFPGFSNLSPSDNHITAVGDFYNLPLVVGNMDHDYMMIQVNTATSLPQLILISTRPLSILDYVQNWIDNKITIEDDTPGAGYVTVHLRNDADDANLKSWVFTKTTGARAAGT
jgi:hypothetical protein